MTPTLLSAQQTTGNQPIQIVLIGNGTITLGAYQSLSRYLHSAILKGKVQLILVSAEQNHTCYGWMMECITEIVDYKNLVVPLSECFKHALHVNGKLVGIDSEAKQLHVIVEYGQTKIIPYDHLLVGDQYFTDTLQNSKTVTGFTIQSTLDMLKTRQQLVFLTERAALAKDRFTASRVLRVAIVGDGFAGVELASNITAYLRHLCGQYELPFIKPTIYLVVSNTTLMESGDDKAPKIDEYIRQHLEDIGVRIIYNKQVSRVNTDGAVLQDGSFINCSIVYCTNHAAQTFKIADSLRGEGNTKPVADLYGRLKNYPGTWIAGTFYHDEILPTPCHYIDKISAGRNIGKNIARTINKRPLLPSKPGFISSAGSLDAGKGFVVISGILLTGWLAYCIRIVLVLYHMPALQRSACIRNWISFFIWKREKVSQRKSVKGTTANQLPFTQVAM